MTREFGRSTDIGPLMRNFDIKTVTCVQSATGRVPAKFTRCPVAAGSAPGRVGGIAVELTLECLLLEHRPQRQDRNAHDA